MKQTDKLQIRIDPELKADIQSTAMSLGISVSGLIRMAVIWYMNQQGERNDA